MTTVRLCAAALLRRHLGGVVAIALLVGFGGGAAMAAAAGARRTSSAATRLYRRGEVADAELGTTSDSTSTQPIDVARLRRIPGVRRAVSSSFFALVDPRRPQQPGAFLAANTDPAWLYAFDRIGLLPSFQGRMPDRARVDEVAATTQEARALHVKLGDSLHVAVASFASPSANAPTSVTPVTLHVVAIATTPVGLLQGGSNTESILFGTPAFATRFAAASAGSTVYVQLRRPADMAGFEQRLAHALPGTTVQVKAASQELTTFSRVASPYTNTLWVFALVAALSTLLVVAQALIRMVRSDGAEDDALRALGTTSGQRAAVFAYRALVGMLVGTALAVVVAILASPLFPLGLVHRVEPEPGIRIDTAILALGAAIILVCLGAVAFTTARRVARRSASSAERGARPSSTASTLARMNAPVSVVAGTRLAFARGRNVAGATSATSIFGLVAAIAAISAALVFGANLDQLTTPRRYGQTWDAEVVASSTTPFSPTRIQTTLARRGLANALTFGAFGDVKLADRVVHSYGVRSVRGNAGPAAIRGRLPVRDDEIALGAHTLRQLGRGVGDVITATANDGSRQRLRIVGQTLLPSLDANTPALGADDGALLTRDALDRLNPDVRGDTDFALVDLAPGRTVTDLRHAFAPDDFTVTGVEPPGYIASYGNVQATPLILAGLLTLLGLGVLTHLLVTSVRSSRREFAVLKTLGCTRRQLSGIVIWQTLLVVGVSCAIGLVVGVGLGRAAWSRFADGLGLAPTIDLPSSRLIAVVAVALGAAVVIALLPARAVTRIGPARALRTE